MAELKPCPFCGGSAHVGELKKSVSPRFYVFCSNNKENCIAAEKYIFGAFYYTRKEAIEAWNRREDNGES